MSAEYWIALCVGYTLLWLVATTLVIALGDADWADAAGLGFIWPAFIVISPFAVVGICAKFLAEKL